MNLSSRWNSLTQYHETQTASQSQVMEPWEGSNAELSVREFASIVTRPEHQQIVARVIEAAAEKQTAEDPTIAHIRQRLS